MITKFGLIFAKIFAISFFTFHYGLFMIIYMIVIFKEFGHIQDISNGLIESFKQIRLYFLKIWPSLLMLFMSHGASFFINYIGKREYKRADPGAIMFMPYQRVFVMHFTIFVIALLTVAFSIKETPTVLLVTIFIKIIGDLYGHWFEHLTYQTKDKV